MENLDDPSNEKMVDKNEDKVDDKKILNKENEVFIEGNSANNPDEKSSDGDSIHGQTSDSDEIEGFNSHQYEATAPVLSENTDVFTLPQVEENNKIVEDNNKVNPTGENKVLDEKEKFNFNSVKEKVTIVDNISNVTEIPKDGKIIIIESNLDNNKLPFDTTPIHKSTQLKPNLRKSLSNLRALNEADATENIFKKFSGISG